MTTNETRRIVHVGSELVAIAIIAPVLWRMSLQNKLQPWEKTALKLIAIATVLVDGWLLLQWRNDDLTNVR